MSQSSPDIPRRHGADVERGRRMARALKPLIKGDPEPTAQQWQAIGESLNHGDPAMDALVAWMVTHGMGPARRLFDQAVVQGIASIDDPPQPLRQFFEQVENTPAWVDQKRLAAGARACGISGLTGLRALRDLGLMAGYQASAINRTLVLTGTLKKGAQRRVAETTKWWLDATRPGGMARGAPGWNSTLQVRLIHALVRRALSADARWDSREYGLPINQCDMHATWLAFSVIFLFGQRLLGVPLSAREGRDVMHLWKYIGWLMGVEARWLVDSEQQGRVALYQNLLAQAPPDDSSRELGRALMEEPLYRQYKNLGWLRGRWNRALHLSIERTFLGKSGMRALGLPDGVLPWYPLISFAPRISWHMANRVLPGGRARLERQGQRQQQAYLRVLFGQQTPRLIQDQYH
ncbi:oxygenase MpaB family protein [Sinimarinibacterium sp. NLF-5-8]|uniref:oxygenase MpaB family protein n=1 Tax=Sinimarinibacterium sp. NLF-5-8 TaxID=2698684 RepID=UPI00137BFF19|nr:oxygenase MpaB family protein [Sinimarinibacterium sp. NLF-5-8]QHS10448.1 DUF2236 domain-containing protein [Sinimarinibacterium sp. NLF-5-8]